MQLGAHQSIAGGLHLAIESAVADGCASLQIFCRNQRQWAAKPLTDQEIAEFRDAVARWGVPRERILVHDSYLINVAAADHALRRRSLAALIEELERCAVLGLPYLVMHPGAHMGQGEATGLQRVAESVSEALAATDGPDAPMILLENTAGQGTALGYRFEHLRDLLATIEPRARVGVCIDTQHTFAAGYDLSTEDGYAATFDEIERVFGLGEVRGFHLNDSKRPLGVRVDRHELIGEGYIGRDCFARLVNDVRFADLPAVLELPPPYPPQLTRLRRMADGTATARRRPTRRAHG